MLLGADAFKRFGPVIDCENDAAHSRRLGRCVQARAPAPRRLALDLGPWLEEANGAPSARPPRSECGAPAPREADAEKETFGLERGVAREQTGRGRMS